MFSYALHLSLFLLYIFPTAHTADAPAYNPVDLILINCGATERANDTAGRMWDRDERSRYSSADADQSLPERIPYETARIFQFRYKYSFPVASSGHKFLRLYFCPKTYAGFNTSQSLFSVIANDITLLSNFSASLNSQYLGQSYLTKEFIIYADGNKRVNLTFFPNPNSFAFANGIEIVSLPNKLYFRSEQIKLVPSQLYDLNNGTGLETLYRLNVGGGDVPIQDDTGMFRYWSKDDGYILGADFGYTPHDEGLVINYTTDTPPYSAPKGVYTSMRTMTNTSRSLEWVFPVDSGFNYLLRFHFCEFLIEITKINDRAFTIKINNEPAELEADVINWTGGRNIPIFKDYIARVPNDGHLGKTDLRLSLFPSTELGSKYLSAFLNGLEIFKLSDAQTLAAANPEQPKNTKSAQNHKKNVWSLVIKYTVATGVVAIFAVIILVSYLIFRQNQARDAITMKQTNGSSSTSLPSALCRRFSLGEIKTATWNFDDNLLIGRGGFGNVYKGFIDEGTTAVAVKRLNTSSKQGPREFLTEIGMLSRLRNVHLVSLIGYCNDNGEMILVYEYMGHGSLRDHLYNSNNPPLTWKQRLNICLGVARGLHHLHTSAKYTIIHRDVKSTNILLDENWVAKMSDFGLSKVGPTDPSKMHVTTMVKGSFGYIDPEYHQRQQLTEKSDVYSLGVVLFEVLCNRPAIDVKLPMKQINLAEFAKSSYREGTIEEMIDCKMRDQIAPECLFKFVDTAIRCVRDEGVKRPAMIDVVWGLEFAMKLQLAAEDCVGGGRFDSPLPGFLLIGQKDPNSSGREEVSVGEAGCWSNVNHSGSDAPEVFTDLMNPTGR